MEINHTTASDVIQAMQIRIDEQQATIERLRAALRECHRHMVYEQADLDLSCENPAFRDLFREGQ